MDFLNGCSVNPITDFSEGGERFSLSPRERAGVRGNMTVKI
jgi:hypothetical protein